MSGSPIWSSTSKPSAEVSWQGGKSIRIVRRLQWFFPFFQLFSSLIHLQHSILASPLASVSYSPSSPKVYRDLSLDLRSFYGNVKNVFLQSSNTKLIQ